MEDRSELKCETEAFYFCKFTAEDEQMRNIEALLVSAVNLFVDYTFISFDQSNEPKDGKHSYIKEI